ncbi:MAG TPA: OmpA family protein [Ideonella sp.]|uniref:OmpA family protein n=1 Tax=Ideonella sp. TaxID=1929293 RepID=UPI002BBAD1D8|nr:OmpA family protein [Ideonella sp.]HSI51877.1 OmpA family protein [Ideonella sp.]
MDESQRRPVNAKTAVELQVCKNELQNTRLAAAESRRLTETTAATLANMAARQQILAAMQAPSGQQRQANTLFTVRFEFGSTRVAIPADVTSALVEEAKASPLVLLRGRTDGTSDAPAESRIARDRAAAVRDYLVAAGVEPGRIRTTYQPTGDPVADNASAGGRALNRRVEIELYRALPVALSATAVVQP